MTTPDFRSIMPGRRERSRRTAASRLTSSILCQSSSVSTFESACFCFRSPDIIHQDVESTPLSLNAIDDVLDTAGRSKIRLYKESRILAVSCLRSRGRGHRGTAQCKAACNRFPYTLRATSHENTLAFELTAKNGKWIAVCHGPSKR